MMKANHTYEAIHPSSSPSSSHTPLDPRPSDDLSTTEMGDSLIGDAEATTHEKQHWDVDIENYHSHRRRSPSKLSACLAILKPYRWIVEMGLLVGILILLLREQKGRGELVAGGSGKSSSERDVGGDITGVGPKFSTQITTFKINQTYAPYNPADFFKPGVLEAWNDLMPKGMGFQHVRDPAQYHDLPHPVVWPNKTVFTTSFTHQLHCLFAVVQTYSGLKSNTTLPDDHHWHMIHCFDYMRQAIMCSADMALEGRETTFPDHNGGSDGWDSKHVCRDPEQVRDYLESVRAYDDRQIY